MTDKKKKKVLFVCTHNSARSQMAEALLNTLYGDSYEGYSGGTHPSEINPFAVEIMKEIGIDISDHKAKNVSQFVNDQFDYVITVCDKANETCPFFPTAGARLHKGFEDPSRAMGTDQEILNVFTRVRDDIKEWIEQTFGE